jgi:pectate lyase
LSGLLRKIALGLTVGAGLLGYFVYPATPAPDAFPGAVGYGKAAAGGRGGAVFQVTNLNNSGVGSLRACVEATGPRTCVFRVGGTISLTSSLSITGARSFLTIAGQTAPGGGITVSIGPAVPSGSRHGIIISGTDVIIRHLRVRMQYPSFALVPNADALAVVTGGNRLYFDHMSLSWATDENFNLFANWLNVTLANSILGEGLDDHSKCMLTGDNNTVAQNMTIYRNLCITNRDRNPNLNSIGGSCQDIINNVLYNPASEFGEIFSQFADSNGDGTPSNWVGNYFKAGPATVSSTFAIFWNNANSAPNGPLIYETGSVLYAPAGKTVTLMNAATNAHRVQDPVCGQLSATATDANTAYDNVRAYSGAWPRDSQDTTYLNQLGARGVNGTGPSSIPEAPGTLPTIANGSPYTDADADGMDDTWETARGLSPSNAADRNTDRNGDGYTNLEEFLQDKHLELIGQEEDTGDPCFGSLPSLIVPARDGDWTDRPHHKPANPC